MLHLSFSTARRVCAIGCILLCVTLLPGRWSVPADSAPLAASLAVADRNFQTGLLALQNGDYRTGFEILAPIAKQGDKRAQYCIGLLYAQGNYLPQDDVKARQWYRLAAGQGHTNAQNNLGLLCKQGRGGPKDLVQAFMWFDVAAERGNINALRNRENVRQLLTPDKLALAQNLAASWRPGQDAPTTPEMSMPQQPEVPDPADTQPAYAASDGRTMEQLVTARTLRVALPLLPRTADPQRTSANAALAVNLYDRLVEYKVLPDGSTALVPGLAAQWTLSNNGTTYTFALRENVRFHNGDTLSAQDVAYTFKRLLAPATGSYNARLFANIKSVSAAGSHTVRIMLKKPYAPLLALLATPWASVLNQSFAEPLGEAYGRSPATTCGSGPFMLARFSGLKGAFLRANPEYFRGPAQIDGVLIRLEDQTRKLKQLFTSGQLDVLDTDRAPELLPYFRNFQSWKDRIQTVRRMGLLFVTLNENLVPFNDLRVRKAFLHAIDRKRLLDLLFRGQGQLVNGVLPNGMLCAAGDAPEDGKELRYDPQRSRELLHEAGVESAALTLIQVNQWNELLARLNAQIKEMAEGAGFSVRIVSMDENAFFELRDSGDAPSYVQIWEADFNDPDTFFTPFFTAPGTRKNSLNYTNKQAARKIDTARTLSDADTRCAAYQELERQIVAKDAAWLPLFSRSHAFILGPRVRHLPRAWNGGSSIPYYTATLAEASEDNSHGAPQPGKQHGQTSAPN